MEKDGMKEINKAYVGSIGTEILDIKWVSWKCVDPSVDLGGPKLCLHVRLKNGKEEYVPLYLDTYYPIICEDEKHKETNMLNMLIVH
ncbi:MAG: hypothetical protein Q8N87_01495 [bacterium]|nr:hypothetical protein [bacterium]